MSARISIAGVSERDIDLLLLEEFQSSISFQEWFLSQTLGNDASLGQCVSAVRSVTQSTGESDLEVGFSTPDGRRTRILIENKINAGMQPSQAERYRLRGDGYILRHECSAYHTILVAPERYFGESAGTKGFDHRLTYEELRRWFETAESLGERRNYKILLLSSAIDKGTLGYQPEEDLPTTTFWREYWLLARQRAPELEMKEPGSKPSGSTFVLFRPPSLPRNVDICHKLTHGFVDLQLRGMGQRLNEVHALMGSYFLPEMRIAPAEKSAALRLAVPVLDTNAALETQQDAVLAGLDAAKQLLRWFMNHQGLWEAKFASHAAPRSASALD